MLSPSASIDFRELSAPVPALRPSLAEEEVESAAAAAVRYADQILASLMMEEAVERIQALVTGPFALSLDEAQAEVVGMRLERQISDPRQCLAARHAAGLYDVGGRLVLSERGGDALRAAGNSDRRMER